MGYTLRKVLRFAAERRRRYVFSAGILMLRSAGFQTCRIADFQVGSTALRPAGLETRATADSEVCATLYRILQI